jgi:thioredoxin-related protein
LDKKPKTYLLLYKSTSSIGDCASEHILEASNGKNDITLLKADVSKVRDIHPNYPVNSVPALLYFNDREMVNVLKGCNDANYYRTVFDNVVYTNKEGKEVVQKRVTVYTTPRCSWCNTLKSYLKKNDIRFREIDVSKDPKQAEAHAKQKRSAGGSSNRK